MKREEVLEMIKSLYMIILHIVYFTLGSYAGQEFINCDTNVYHTM